MRPPGSGRASRGEAPQQATYPLHVYPLLHGLGTVFGDPAPDAEGMREQQWQQPGHQERLTLRTPLVADQLLRPQGDIKVELTVEVGQRLGRRTLQAFVEANATAETVHHGDFARRYGSRVHEHWQPWDEIEGEGVARPLPGMLPPPDVAEVFPELTAPFQQTRALYGRDCSNLVFLFDSNRLRLGQGQ
jgi:hypothetical protein